MRRGTRERSSTVIGGLTIVYDAGVLEPRPWTELQGAWAAALARTAPDGPVLEVCSGAGHIGLVAAARSGRALVQVDADPAACRFALTNATANGMADRVEVHCATIDQVRGWGERFPIVIADPPYIATADIGRFPEDPRLAIDGGPDGLALARACLELFRQVLLPGGSALLQLGAAAHVAAMARACPPDLALRGARTAGPTRHVAHFTRETPAFGATSSRSSGGCGTSR